MATKKLAEIIKEKITKSASSVGNIEYSRPHKTELEYNNIELVINGKKTKCDINLWVEYTAEWYIEEQTYDYPGWAEVRDVDYSIEDIGIDTEDGTIFTEEQEKKILEENEDFLYDYIQEDVFDAAEGQGI